jgi:hypothetical protein
MQLDKLVSDAVQSALTSEAIQAKVQAAAAKAVSEAIDSAFGYSSPFRKSLQESIAGVLPIVREQDLATFTHAVREVVKTRLQTVAHDTAAMHVGKAIDDLLPDEPVIYLEDLRESYADYLRQEAEGGCHCDGDYEPEHTFEVDKPDWSDKTRFVYFAEESGRDQYDACVSCLAFSLVGDVGRCYHAQLIEKKDARYRVSEDVRQLFAGPLYGFHSMLFRLATGLAELDFSRKPRT